MKTIKKIRTIAFCLSILSVPVVFQACSKNDDSENREWRKQNEAYFDNFSRNPEYKTREIPGGPGFVYYKVIQAGEGATPVEGADVKVQVKYKGWTMNEVVFDSSGEYTRTFTFQNGQLIDGWLVALAYMQEGDKWNVIIPWTLGYKQSSTASIPAYSTLIFDIELVKVIGL